MPSLPQRIRKLQTQLLAIRLGSGAVILPKEVQRIHLRFAARMEGGHMGPRKFWRQEMVRLKYHNPSIPMTVERHDDNGADSEATMSIHLSSPSSTTSPAKEESERIETIDMKFQTNSQILSRLVELTKARSIEPTPDEVGELRLLEEQRVRGERDRRQSAEARARVKREKELLEQARGELAGEM